MPATNTTARNRRFFGRACLVGLLLNLILAAQAAGAAAPAEAEWNRDTGG